MLRDVACGSIGQEGQPGDAARMDIDAIADDGRQLAGDGVAAIRELALKLCTELREQSRARHQAGVDQLTRAEAVGSPCTDGHGSVEVPVWADRRRSSRTRHGLQAHFEIDGSLQRAAVLDASEYGLGVLGLRDAVAGSRVSLLLGPGLSIGGRVVWVSGVRAGIELDVPLPPDSQLLPDPL
jgi:hypothetical protein